MTRYLLYFTVSIAAFSIGSFIAFSLYWQIKSSEFQNVEIQCETKVEHISQPAQTPIIIREGGLFGHTNNHFALNDKVFFAESSVQNKKIIKSQNRGKSWQSVYSRNNKDIDNLLENYVKNFYFIDELHGWIAGQNGTWETLNGGKTWNKIFNNEIAQIFFTNQSTGWINLTDGVKQRGYKTRNGGKTWKICSQTNEKISLTGDGYFISAEKGWAFIGKDYGDDIPFRIAETTDGGCHWKEIWKDSQSFHFRHSDLYFISEKIGWYSTLGDNGLFKTTDGGKKWNEVIIPKEQSEIETYFFKNESEGWILFASLPENPILYKTFDGGKSWVASSKQDFLKSYEKNVNFPRVSSGLRSAIVIQSIPNN